MYSLVTIMNNRQLFSSPLYGEIMLEKLLNHDLWLEFLNEKLKNEYLSNNNKKIFSAFINNKEYLTIARGIIDNTYVFSIPKKHVISKHKNNKKRIVYNYSKDEMIILKYIGWCLNQYDYLFSNNLYSFRKNNGVKLAIKKLSHIKTLHGMYGYKLDISNYFNSIYVDRLLKNLKEDVDLDIYTLIHNLLKQDYVEFHDELIKEEKGVMAGQPLSGFLANYYIKDIDKLFENEGILYLRYADDIILFANTAQDIEKYEQLLKEQLSSYGLIINPEKEEHYLPGESFNFLGFEFNKDSIDITNHAVDKMKSKIKRKANRLRLWARSNNLSYEKALKAMIKIYNIKFFGKSNEELSWQYWFFPYITSSNKLKIIDQYLEQELRYIVTGKHNKMNYKKVPYEKLKENGYRSLVNEYYSFHNSKQ
ncbi:MAG: hypothetical protein HUJ61_05040 [Bacilli bacterium]|nr:hypothetical protein [Bacilli bacterium]